MYSTLTYYSSKVFKYDDSNDQFSQHQSLPTLGAIDIEHIRIRSLDLLIVANNRDNTVSSPQQSEVYRWDITTQMFVLHEKLETNRVQDVEVFMAFDDTGKLMETKKLLVLSVFRFLNLIYYTTYTKVILVGLDVMCVLTKTRRAQDYLSLYI